MRTLNLRIDNPGMIETNPYEIIGVEPKPFTSRDLFIGEVLKHGSGNYYRVKDFGGGAFFGKGSYSYLGVEFQLLKEYQPNPNRFYISISTHNPKEVYHRTPERPEGSKYGGVGFGGWCSSVEKCIKEHFPKEHTKKSTGPLYWNKTLKIESITKTDLITGVIKQIKITSKYNTLLQNLKK